VTSVDYAVVIKSSCDLGVNKSSSCSCSRSRRVGAELTHFVAVAASAVDVRIRGELLIQRRSIIANSNQTVKVI